MILELVGGDSSKENGIYVACVNTILTYSIIFLSYINPLYSTLSHPIKFYSIMSHPVTFYHTLPYPNLCYPTITYM